MCAKAWGRKKKPGMLWNSPEAVVAGGRAHAVRLDQESMERGGGQPEARSLTFPESIVGAH